MHERTLFQICIFHFFTDAITLSHLQYTRSYADVHLSKARSQERVNKIICHPAVHEPLPLKGHIHLSPPTFPQSLTQPPFHRWNIVQAATNPDGPPSISSAIITQVVRREEGGKHYVYAIAVDFSDGNTYTVRHCTCRYDASSKCAHVSKSGR